MTYAFMRKQVKTGDVLIVRGTGIISRLVRTFTGESYSHVALLVWEKDGLHVFEFVEGVGFQSMPTSEWLRRRRKQKLYLGVAPKVLGDHAGKIKAAAVKYRNGSVMSRMYGYFSLVKVWLSQKIGKKIPVHQRVCSTFVQECWSAGFFSLKRTADPGDIADACSALHALYLLEGDEAL